MSALIPIILLGDTHDAAIGECICRGLQTDGEVLHIRNGGIAQYAKSGGNAREFAVIEPSAAAVDLQGLTKGIVLLKENTGALQSMKLPDNISVLVASGNYRALSLIPATCKRVITCGMSARDTLSLSANVGGSASVSLQRKIRDLRGRWIHERELPLKNCGDIGSYEILTLTAIRLLFGAKEDE
ncbi:MAG: hypothetical protein ACI4IV_00495 [Acutalibacteraceae bacterium]